MRGKEMHRNAPLLPIAAPTPPKSVGLRTRAATAPRDNPVSMLVPAPCSLTANAHSSSSDSSRPMGIAWPLA